MLAHHRTVKRTLNILYHENKKVKNKRATFGSQPAAVAVSRQWNVFLTF